MPDAPAETLLTNAALAFSALIGIPFLHFVFMRIDLALRNPEQMSQGGIPELATRIFQYCSILLFGGLIFLSLAQIDSFLIRLVIAALATTIAFLTMIFCWLRYVTGNGIDTL